MTAPLKWTKRKKPLAPGQAHAGMVAAILAAYFAAFGRPQKSRCTIRNDSVYTGFGKGAPARYFSYPRLEPVGLVTLQRQAINLYHIVVSKSRAISDCGLPIAHIFSPRPWWGNRGFRA